MNRAGFTKLLLAIITSCTPLAAVSLRAIVSSVALATILPLAGCSTSPSGGGSLVAASAGSTSVLASGQVDADQARSVLMSLADSYTQTIVQPLDMLVTTSKDLARTDWARTQRLGVVSASVANATGPNSVVGLLDMVVFATLKRAAVEEHWVPTLLKEEGQSVLDAHRRGEKDAWAAAGRIFSASQLKELRELVEKWRRDHPGQYYVGYTRFSDFDEVRSLTPDSPQARMSGSLFGALYMDPLAGLDPVARELSSYRALTERLAFIVTRMPLMMAYQIDLGVHSATGAPELRRFVTSAEGLATQAVQLSNGTYKIAEQTRVFAEAAVKYPQQLSVEREAAVNQLADVTARERKAAIEQAAGVVAVEREAIFKRLDEQEGRVRTVLADVSKLLDQADRVTASMSASTTNTVTSTRNAADGALTHATLLGLIFLACLLLGVPLSMLGYRLACRRLLGVPAVQRDPSGGGDGGGPSDTRDSAGSAGAGPDNRRRIAL